MKKTGLYLCAGIACLLVFAGCASKGPVPVEALNNAEIAIKAARDSNAIVNAPLELRLAEDNLKSAKASVESQEYDKARQFAERATFDAKLAEAKTRSEKARKGATEMKESINTLRNELERNQRN